MFSRETDASKIALIHLVARLNEDGFSLLDTQFTTDHLISLGAIEVSRNDYLAQLNKALLVESRFNAKGSETSHEAFVSQILEY